MGIQDWAIPPLAKVYEALGAVVDGRVIIASPTSGPRCFILLHAANGHSSLKA